MSSFTCDILPGSGPNPEFTTIIKSDKGRTYWETHTNRFKVTLWIPGVSTLSGLVLTIISLTHTVFHSICSLISDDKKHTEEAKLGIRNLVYGVVGMLPIAGNIALYIYDYFRFDKFDKPHDADFDCIHLYGDGSRRVRMDVKSLEFKAKRAGYSESNPPGFWDTVSLFQTHEAYALFRDDK